MERRKETRTRINYPIYFVCVDYNGNESDQDMAIALDISESGMLIETSKQIQANSIKIMSTTTKDKVISVKGAIVYSYEFESGKYRTGIFFNEPSEINFQFAQEVLKAAGKNDIDN